MTDLGELYRLARLRVTEVVAGVDERLLVPATPAWTLHDVIAHLCGVAVDVAAGNVDGAATDPWTARQVERARDTPVAELLDEWAAAAPGLESLLSSPAGPSAGAAVMDIHCHEADLRTALGLAPAIPDEFLEWGAAHMRAALERQVAKAGLPPIQVDASDFELFRARLGRRTRAEVCAFGWTADPEPYLDTFFIFGPTDHPVGP
jgi:uncharacterized protein (TIGR03083 family)